MPKQERPPFFQIDVLCLESRSLYAMGACLKFTAGVLIGLFLTVPSTLMAAVTLTGWLLAIGASVAGSIIVGLSRWAYQEATRKPGKIEATASLVIDDHRSHYFSWGNSMRFYEDSFTYSGKEVDYERYDIWVSIISWGADAEGYMMTSAPITITAHPIRAIFRNI
ncbi:MAG: hypothetical protein M2R45_03434 [Verrucomicrobia subdivision 3 bacterium]|nr:hypothetical protein [Limisphaerales bacterium]MCS1416338.1 hypothetical protein [Limisphaerales bacterium]